MKLYWRYKKDAKWTWKPATVTAVTLQGHIVQPLSVFIHKNDRGHLDEKSPNAEGGTRRACPPREGRANAKRSGAVECRGDQ